MANPFSEEGINLALAKVAKEHPEQFSCNDPENPDFMRQRLSHLANPLSLLSRRLYKEMMNSWPEQEEGGYAWIYENEVGEKEIPASV